MTEHKSGEEIERVFKVSQLPKNLEQYPSEKIVQGYLSIDANGAEVRRAQLVRSWASIVGSVVTTPSSDPTGLRSCPGAVAAR